MVWFSLKKTFLWLSFFPGLLFSLNFPSSLNLSPKADKQGIVLGVKKIQIRGVEHFYNASLVEFGDAYRLFFRLDTPCVPPFVSHIGCVELDADFNQTQEEYFTLATGTEHSEDPRALWVGDDLWVIYTDVGQYGPTSRIMRAAEVDSQTFKIKNIIELDLQQKPVEKNWPPFEIIPPGAQAPQLFFEYQISPQVIAALSSDASKEVYFHQDFPEDKKKELIWPKTWGQMRGGTPAKKISEDEYLAFFHSSFADGFGVRWYIMGAYTFSANSPYTINKISSYPILYDGIYDTPTYRNDLRVIFPAGFVIEKKESGDLIHLSCGENDMGVVIVTMDKRALLDSLKPAKDIGKGSFRRF